MWMNLNLTSKSFNTSPFSSTTSAVKMIWWALNNYIACICIIRLWLSHLPLVSHMRVRESGQYWFRQWLVAYSAPSHYLNQCWFIVNWTRRNKLQWKFNQNTKLSFTKKHMKISSAKWLPFCPRGDELIHLLNTMTIDGTDMYMYMYICVSEMGSQHWFNLFLVGFLGTNVGGI